MVMAYRIVEIPRRLATRMKPVDLHRYLWDQGINTQKHYFKFVDPSRIGIFYKGEYRLPVATLPCVVWPTNIKVEIES
jgi:hypothetical protein